MIRSEDFQIEVGYSGDQTYVRVTHRPTGRTRESVEPANIGKTRDALIAELKASVFNPDDFRIDLNCGPGVSRFVVTHLPSGSQRHAENTETDSKTIVPELIDQILDELHTANGRRS